MKNKLIFSFILTLLQVPICFGTAVMESRLTLIVPSSAVVKTMTSSKNNSGINPQNGYQSGLEAIFNIKTNGDDNTYDFILSSSLETLGGIKNAYVLNNDNLYLMLGNKEHLPDTTAAADIESGTPDANPNIIAYPVINNSPFDIKPINYNGGLCCQILSGGEQDMNIIQTIGNTPLRNTYSVSEDNAGVYEAAVTLNIYRKP